MAERKLSTEEILALARQQDSHGANGAAGESGQQPQEESASEAPQEPAAQQEASAKAEEKTEHPSSASGSAGSTPKSTADILAAARAEASGSGGGGASPAPSSKSENAAKPAGKPAAGTKTKAKPASAGGSGPRPSVQEMLKAVREGRPRREEKPTPTKPVFPQKPAPPKTKPTKEPRRSFLVQMVATPFALGWTLFTAASVAAGLAMARFMMPNAIVEPPSKFKIGTPEDYPLGTVTTKWKSEFGIWITHQIYNGQPQLYALATICTHLGCTPNWLEAEQKFKCPCHGSGFYPDGINFEGPAPRPLERYGIRIAPDGLLEVDKSVTFQEEMGEWTDPTSFVATTA